MIVDDHAIVRGGLARLFAALPDVELIEMETGEEALTIVRRERPQLVILDLNLPGLGGLELLRRLLRIDASLPVVVFSMHAETIYAARALEAGARGYVSKNAAPDELLMAIRAVLHGGSYVEAEIAQELGANAADGVRAPTGRELEIMRLLAQGRSLTEIADILGVAYKTVANTLSHIKDKLGVESTAELIRISIGQGLA
ncbi:MAG TPA: response regulator transcription factor [Rhizomicrobium sp.]|nr:response regulator transcription factor [Rhizomicrobium sp.]